MASATKAPAPKFTDREMKAIFDAAHAAGMAAGNAAMPTPMHVIERADPFDDASPITKDYGMYADGVCGFAWIIIRPGGSCAARYAKKHDIGRPDSYYGGMSVWVSYFRQSMARKEAYAHAYAKVLNDAGITAYPYSRMD